MFAVVKNWWKNYNLKLKEQELRRDIAKLEEMISWFTKSPNDPGYKEEQESIHEIKYLLGKLQKRLKSNQI